MPDDSDCCSSFHVARMTIPPKMPGFAFSGSDVLTGSVPVTEICIGTIDTSPRIGVFTSAAKRGAAKSTAQTNVGTKSFLISAPSGVGGLGRRRHSNPIICATVQPESDPRLHLCGRCVIDNVGCDVEIRCGCHRPRTF